MQLITVEMDGNASNTSNTCLEMMSNHILVKQHYTLTFSSWTIVQLQ